MIKETDDVVGLIERLVADIVREEADSGGPDDGNPWHTFTTRISDVKALLAALQSQSARIAELDALRRSIAERVAEGDGMWRTCSGCHESEDGYDVGHYPHSDVFDCKLGGGCLECGGIGAVWDNIDYEKFAEDMIEQEKRRTASLTKDSTSATG